MSSELPEGEGRAVQSAVTQASLSPVHSGGTENGLHAEQRDSVEQYQRAELGREHSGKKENPRSVGWDHPEVQTHLRSPKRQVRGAADKAQLRKTALHQGGRVLSGGPGGGGPDARLPLNPVVETPAEPGLRVHPGSPFSPRASGAAPRTVGHLARLVPPVSGITQDSQRRAASDSCSPTSSGRADAHPASRMVVGHWCQPCIYTTAGHCNLQPGSCTVTFAPPRARV